MHNAGLQSSLGGAAVSNVHFVAQGQLLDQVYPDVLVDDKAAQALQRAQLQEARHGVGELHRVGGGAGRREPEGQKALFSESPMERSVRSTMDRVPPRPSCSSKLSLPLECSILVWRVLWWERKLLLSR